MNYQPQLHIASLIKNIFILSVYFKVKFSILNISMQTIYTMVNKFNLE